MIYHSIEDIKNLAEEKQVPMWRIIMEKDMEERQVTEGETFEAMRAMYLAMKQADQSYNGALSSPSGLAGGDGERLHAYNQTGNSLMGAYPSLVMEKDRKSVV